MALRDELDLGDHVEFTGRAPDDLVVRIMSTADVGLSPDPKNPLNDLSTMNKTMEYMAFELPVLAFDLRETRVSAGEAGVYVTPNDVDEYATALVGLMDDELRRILFGKLGRARVEQHLAWHHQRRAYLDVYRRLLGGRSPDQTTSDSRPRDQMKQIAQNYKSGRRRDQVAVAACRARNCSLPDPQVSSSGTGPGVSARSLRKKCRHDAAR